MVRLMSVPYIIFDFDGTLVDSFRTAMRIFNHLSDEFQFRKVGDEEVESLRDFTSRELIKYLQIPLYKIPTILRSARKMMCRDMQTLQPFYQLPETLLKLTKINVPLGILTSNSAENVTAWLQRHNLENLFSFIHAESSFFGKKRILKKIIKAHQMDKTQTFYVGDETRDVEAANECGISSVAVSWGFNSLKVLTAHQPQFVLQKPEDLLTLF